MTANSKHPLNTPTETELDPETVWDLMGHINLVRGLKRIRATLLDEVEAQREFLIKLVLEHGKAKDPKNPNDIYLIVKDDSGFYWKLHNRPIMVPQSIISQSCAIAWAKASGNDNAVIGPDGQVDPDEVEKLYHKGVITFGEYEALVRLAKLRYQFRMDTIGLRCKQCGESLTSQVSRCKRCGTKSPLIRPIYRLPSTLMDLADEFRSASSKRQVLAKAPGWVSNVNIPAE